MLAPDATEVADETEGQALLDRQRDLEDHMLGLGGERFRRSLYRAQAKDEASTVGAGFHILRHAIAPVEQGIRTLLEEKGKRGPKHIASRWLAMIDPAAAAYITSRVIIDGIHSATPLRAVAAEIAGMLLDEMRYRRLEECRPALFAYKTDRLPGTNYSHNKRVMDQAVRWALEHSREGDAELDMSDLSMSDQHKLLVGAKLVDLFAATTGLVEVKSKAVVKGTAGRSRRSKMRTELYLEASADTREWLEQRNGVLEMLTPVCLPTILPPRPWAPGQRGGYHFGLRNKYGLIRGASKEQERLAATASMPAVYDAVNTIQNTAWKINRPVYDLVKTVLYNARPVGNLPVANVAAEPIPAKPRDIAENEDARKRWRSAARAVHERNRDRQVRALGVSKTLLAAERVVDEAAIYFPCSLDFRGRIYPLTHYLSPQGDDLSKALLLFADAKPLGEDGAFWLAIHGANCLDATPEGQKVKTMTMQERASWIQRNTLRICAVADDPFADLWWTDADKPLQFYAFCLEWRGFYEAYKQGRGHEYVCGLPVAQDGSCNGIQHFSALFRDAVGGRAVNLTPEERPQDVYQAVTDAVLARLQQKAAGDGDDAWMARQWLASGLVSRKLCKRPTMTIAYGSKRFGMAEQTLEFMQSDRATWQKIVAHFTKDGANIAGKASQWMAGEIWSALQTTVIAATSAMAWMQLCASVVVSQTQKPLQWTAPSGFPIRQEYFVTNFKQIKTVLAGRIVQPSVLEVTDEVQTRKQATAVAPNVVHSLDASALVFTVLRAAAQGVTSFGMVHDSYATVPADCSVLAAATRQAFVEMYRDGDVVQHLVSCWEAQLPADTQKPLPDAPQCGALDINGVLESTYFFS